jgi:hypothetical protein
LMLIREEGCCCMYRVAEMASSNSTIGSYISGFGQTEARAETSAYFVYQH